MTKTFGNFTDLMDFSRSTSGTALRKVSYGSELVTNGTFDTDTTGWTATGGSNPTLSFSSGQAVVTATQTGSAILEQTSTEFEQGKLYQIKINVVATTDNIDVWNKGTSSVSIKAVKQGENVINYVATQDGYLRFGALGPSFSSGEGFTFDNISVKEVTLDSGTDDPVVFNHPADIPRIEYAADGTVKGLLIEEARTNLLTYSEAFDNAEFIKTNVIITANSVVAPDGTLTADKLIANTTSAEHYTQDSLVPATGTFTDSIYAKSSDDYLFAIRPVHVGADVGNTFTAYFNLNTGTIRSTWPGTTATIEDVGNGWYRCSISYTVSGTLSGAYACRFQLYKEDELGAVVSSYAGDNSTGVYIWGAQREVGSFATSYIPTSGATATRSADLASIAVENFGYNQDEGTVVVEASFLSVPFNGYNRIFELSDSSTSDLISILATQNTSNIYPTISYNGSQQLTYAADTVSSGVSFFTGMVYKKDDVAFCVDGNTILTDTSVNIPTGIDTLYIGGNGTASKHLNGHIRDFQYYPRRLTNRQLQELTGATNTYDYTTVEAGTITRSAVATGSDLVGYSGFSATNYLEQPYNPDLDFGTGDFCLMGWVKHGGSDNTIFYYGVSDFTEAPQHANFVLWTNLGKFKFRANSAYIETSDLGITSRWAQFSLTRSGGTVYLYVDGKLITSVSASSINISGDSTSDVLAIGSAFYKNNNASNALALLRISATAPTAEQIAKIYEDEKVLFQENAQATLYGSSDAVTALAHDDTTNLLHVGTSAGRSVFQGLRRVENTTDAVGTAISASNGLVVEE